MSNTPKPISESQFYSLMESIKHQNNKAFWTFSILLLILYSIFCFLRFSLYAGSACLFFTFALLIFLWKRKHLHKYWDILTMVFIIICYDGALYICIKLLTITSVTNVFFIGYSFAFLHFTLQSRILRLWNMFKVELAIFIGRALIICNLSFEELNNTGFFLHIAFNIIYLFIVFGHQRSEEKFMQHMVQRQVQVPKVRERVFNFIPNGVLVLTQKARKAVYNNQAFQTIYESVVGFLDVPSKDPKASAALRCLEGLQYENTSYSRRNLQEFLQKKFGNQTPNLLNVLHELMRNELYKEELMQVKVSHVMSMGRKKYYEVRVFKTVWNSEEAVVLILNDITENEVANDLRLADANKDKIISTVSHEFRTPLNGIIGILNIIEKNFPDYEMSKYIALCKSNTSLLLSVANTLLDLQQIREGKIKLYSSVVQICNMLEEVKSLFDFQCSSKDIYLRIQIKSGVPKLIQTDVNRLKQILINLIGNSIKFTIEGGITVDVEEDPGNQDCIRFSVQDTGVGMVQEDLKKLFQMFGKLERTESINQSGTGLGLMISDTIARQLNVTTGEKGIKVESQVGEGSRFTFLISKNLRGGSSSEGGNPETIESDDQNVCADSYRSVEDKMNTYTLSLRRTSLVPLIKYNMIQNDDNSIFNNFCDSPKKRFSNNSNAYLDPEQTMLNSDSRRSAFSALSPRGENRSSFYKPKIGDSPRLNSPLALIVDDNPFNVMVAQHLVQANGFKVNTAFNGMTALDLIVKQAKSGQPFKVILMDYEMPIMNGIETMQALNQMIKKGEVPFVPVIAFTAHEKAEEKKKCLDSGMIDVVIKPINEKKLNKVLEKFKS